MGKINLNLLANELQIVPLKTQKGKVGGFDYSVTLPEITISASAPGFSFSFDWGSFSSGYPGDNNSGGAGGGSGSGSGGSGSGGSGNDNSNINDPDNLLDKTKNYLKTTIDALKELIDSGKAPSGTQEYLKALEQTQETLDKMESSDQKYRIDEMSNNGDDINDANVSYDSQTGEIVLSLENGSSNDYSLIIHEITHIEQLMNGDLWIENGNITGYDINDEVEAYQKQHDVYYGPDASKFDLGGNPYPDGDYRVTPEDISKYHPGIYDNLPNQNWSKPGDSGTNSGSASSAS